MMSKLLIKKKCKCGRTIICKKVEHGNTPTPECGVCKKLGLNESRASFLNINKKNYKTEFK